MNDFFFLFISNAGLLVCAETLNRQIDSNAYEPLIHLASASFKKGENGICCTYKYTQQYLV